jgi:uncharacterized membrane protein YkoI
MTPSLRFLPLLGLLLAGQVGASHSADQDEVRRLRASGAIVPLEQLVDDAQRRHAGRVLEAELKHRDGDGGYNYEIEILDEAGVVRELIYDAASGRLLEERTDD